MIELKDITKIFNRNKPNEFHALRGVSLNIEPRKITVLKGPSGSGKTTLLSIIGCMSRPTSGRIFIDGRETTSLPERFLTELRRTRFGFMFQQFHLIKGLTAMENAMIPAYPTDKSASGIRDIAEGLFRRFGISDRAETGVELLSGGEAQRVALARALINSPDIIMADEPTAHLDSALSADVMGLFESLRDQGKTVIISSHDPIVYDSPIVDSVVGIKDGRPA